VPAVSGRSSFLFSSLRFCCPPDKHFRLSEPPNHPAYPPPNPTLTSSCDVTSMAKATPHQRHPAPHPNGFNMYQAKSLTQQTSQTLSCALTKMEVFVSRCHVGSEYKIRMDATLWCHSSRVSCGKQLCIHLYSRAQIAPEILVLVYYSLTSHSAPGFPPLKGMPLTINSHNIEHYDMQP